MSELPIPEIDIDVSHVKTMNNGDIIFYVAAANPNTDKLVVTHSYGDDGQFGPVGLIPNFTALANEYDPYNGEKETLNQIGIKVCYRNYVWKICISNKGQAAQIIREHGNGILEMNFVIVGVDNQESFNDDFLLQSEVVYFDDPEEVTLYYVYKNSDKMENRGRNILQYVTRNKFTAQRLSKGLNGGGRNGKIEEGIGFYIEGELYSKCEEIHPITDDIIKESKAEDFDEALNNIVSGEFTENDVYIVSNK